ncbi:MAG: hypothetical protein ACREHC_01575 [Candidatus Levyibacteriota bacterium]
MVEKINKKQKIIILSIVLGMLLVLTILFYIATNQKSGRVVNIPNEKKITSGSIIFGQPNLYIFNDRRIINQYPDIIRFHYPYFLVITPGDYEHTSTVYSITEKRKVKEFNKVILDYFNGDVLSTDGKTTFFNKKNLNMQCSQGYIKDKTSVYCIVPKDNDPLNNKLISVNPQNGVSQDFYNSDKLITTFTFINNMTYIAEEDTTTQKTYLRIGTLEKVIPTQADIIYPMEGKQYYATFKVNDENREASYYEILHTGSDITTKIMQKGGIVLWK